MDLESGAFNRVDFGNEVGEGNKNH